MPPAEVGGERGNQSQTFEASRGARCRGSQQGKGQSQDADDPNEPFLPAKLLPNAVRHNWVARSVHDFGELLFQKHLDLEGSLQRRMPLSTSQIPFGALHMVAHPSGTPLLTWRKFPSQRTL